MTTTAPHGYLKFPITSDLLVADAVALSDIQLKPSRLSAQEVFGLVIPLCGAAMSSEKQTTSSGHWTRAIHLYVYGHTALLLRSGLQF
jgi:hypothetical protein